MNRLAAVLIAGLSVALVVAEDKDGTSVDFDGLKSTTPAGWKVLPDKKPLRVMTLVVPKAKGDEMDGDVAIFKGITGSKKQNLERWQGQFDAPEGKKISDITKVDDIKVAGCEVMYVDISGTYLDGPPMLPRNQKKKRENYRMLAVQFEAPDNTYHIKFVGPAKTVGEAKKGFDEWVKGFKK